jgi:septal ring factor EnvC (AmiA/AmiB activator)
MPSIEPRRLRQLATRLVSLLTAVALSGALVQAQDRRESQAALDAVRKDIKALEARLAREIARRDDGAKELREVELEIATATRKLGEVRASVSAQQGVRRGLGDETARTERRLATERAALASQVRASYMAGRDELFKLLLSQESPAELGRMLLYFDYYNRARAARIAAVTSDLAKLAELGGETSRVERQLAALAEAQEREVAALEELRDERRAVVAKLDAQINDDNAAVAKLKAEESRLAELVTKLAELSADFPVAVDEPFATLKGKLAWPVEGRLALDFGQPRGSGGVKWSGVLLEAAAGTPVRAVHRGRVAFADWLQGLGLLVIVDHGEGYMSLYGHNEALLKEVGDWIEAGEAVAQVGDSGGQARPGLYFEIRLNGEPVNPHPWVARRPAAGR